MKKTTHSVALAAITCAHACALFSATAHALPICITDNSTNSTCQAGQTNTPPVNGNLPAAANDARWCGSTEYAWTADTMEVRVARYAGGIVLSLEVHDDTGASASTGDGFFVGLWQGTPAAGAGTVIRLNRKPSTSSGTDQGWNTGWTGQQYHRTGNGAWTPYNNQPELVATWVKQGTLADVQVVSSQATSWNMRVLVPFNSAGSFSSAAATSVPLPTNTDFRIWVETRANFTGALATTPRLPSAAALLVESPTFTPPDPSTWQTITVAGGSCQLGVDFDMYGININGGTIVSGTQLNHFHATPLNSSGGNLAADGIKARFRIANFGSSLNWVDVPVPGAVNNCKQATGTSGGTVASGSSFDLTCDWQMTDAQVCDYTGAKCTGAATQIYNAHQCVLADLSASASNTQPIYFSRNSASRNIDFTPSSLIKEEAEIDLTGLPAISGQSGHDVYLHVHTANMADPRDVKDPFTVTGRDAAMGLRKQALSGRLRFRDLVQKMPTYVVYAYYDTGKTQTIDGVQRHLLEAMPSFGYHIYHDGQIVGFKHELQGATLIAPDFYKLNIPNGQKKAKLTLSIESLEPGAPRPDDKPKPDDSAQPPPVHTDEGKDSRLWIWLLLAILAVAIAVLATRKR